MSCVAIAHLERQRVVHRDISPSNFLISLHAPPACHGPAAFEMCDFGMATEIPKGHDCISSTVVVGTPHFIPPEAIEQKIYTFNSHVYSVAAVIYWFMNRQAVPDDLSKLQLEHCPEQLRELLCSMLAQTPEKRPSAEEILARMPRSKDPLREFNQICTTIVGMAFVKAGESHANPHRVFPGNMREMLLDDEVEDNAGIFENPGVVAQGRQSGALWQNAPLGLVEHRGGLNARASSSTSTQDPRSAATVPNAGSVWATPNKDANSVHFPCNPSPGFEALQFGRGFGLCATNVLGGASAAAASSPFVPPASPQLAAQLPFPPLSPSAAARALQQSTLANGPPAAAPRPARVSASTGRARRESLCNPEPYPQGAHGPSSPSATKLVVGSKTFSRDWSREVVATTFGLYDDEEDKELRTSTLDEIASRALQIELDPAVQQAMTDSVAHTAKRVDAEALSDLARPIIFAFVCLRRARKNRSRNREHKETAALISEDSLRRKLVECGIRGLPKSLVEGLLDMLNEKHRNEEESR